LIFSLQRKISLCAKLTELIFFPSFCELCSRLLEYPGERIICRSCWESIRSSHSSYCLCCGRFFESSEESHFCSHCLRERPPFSIHRSCARYKGNLKDIILLYKYSRIRVLGKDLALFAHKILGEKKEIWSGVDAIIPVPLHPKKKRERGFNQAQLLALELARLKRIELKERRLVKVKNIPPQTLLTMEERKKNISDAYRVVKGEQLVGKIVLLVDDVYTTGSTIRECSSVLKKSGVEEVRALTIAQA